MPYLVRENLFIGDIEDAAEILQSDSTETTHILSILSSVSLSFFSEWRSSVSIPAKAIRKVYASGSALEGEPGDCSDTWVAPEKVSHSLEYAGKDLKLVRMAVPLGDMEDENLLDSLDVCLKFIDESRTEGSILVHCFAGVSRSAAVVIAYLMRTEQLSLEDALQSLRQSSESVSPNDGFIKQLKLFEEMGFKVDRSSSIYKQFHLKVLGDSYNQGERIDSSKFGADPGLRTEAEASSTVAPTNGGINIATAYRCKKCRRLVALQENVVEHLPGKGEASFRWHKRTGGYPFNKPNEPECSSIFVEPLRWMTSVEDGALEGKLSCAYCEARLGYFNWSGIQCSCGSWITPAFQLHKCRVDRCAV